MEAKKYIKDNKLIIEVPLETTTYNPYDEEGGVTMPNIIGIIEPQANCNEPEYGFAYTIDMSYKDKAPQWTSLFYVDMGGLEEFKKFCSKNKIDIFEYPQCKNCKKAIYGCYTFGEKGEMCFDCDGKRKDKSKNKNLLEDFSSYCKRHPEERFWQAARNWAGVQFLLFKHRESTYDTFFWKNRNEIEDN